jgi:uncharacterized membrane protein YjjB (DUF3815 family)
MNWLKTLFNGIWDVVKKMLAFAKSVVSADKEGQDNISANRCMFVLGCCTVYWCIVYKTVKIAIGLPDITPFIPLLGFLAAIIGVKEWQEYGKKKVEKTDAPQS